MLRSCFLLALLTVDPASAQLATTLSAANGQTAVTFSLREGSPVYAFSGVPYSGKQTHRRVQTLAGGSHIAAEPLTTSIWQDSAGRKRTEQQVSGVLLTQILDPVDGVIYALDPTAHVAHRVKVNSKLTQVHPHPYSAPPPAHTTNNPDGTTFTSEPLGTRTIGGFTAYGQRMTTHYPAGSKLGNDQPVDSVNELWNIPQLATTLLSKSSDPRFGDVTSTLDDIVSGEPDPSLLLPPSGYRIIDEAGPFIVIYTK
jgi:hypothetical protein